MKAGWWGGGSGDDRASKTHLSAGVRLEVTERARERGRRARRAATRYISPQEIQVWKTNILEAS